MNLKKTFLAALVAMGCLTASAQEQKTEYEFNPHWYIQLQGGVQHTLGEISAKHLFSPNVQVAGGYQFDKVWGARLAINTWQSKGGWNLNYMNNVTRYEWKWNYVAPMLDITANLSNLLGGYNPYRPVSFGVFAGLGLNIAFNNDEAIDVNNQIRTQIQSHVGMAGYDNQNLELLWDGTTTRFVAHVGANVDVRVSDRVAIGLEASANMLSDAYNSKKASNADWYFNALAGVKINLGKTHKKKVVEEAPAKVDTVYIEKVVEKIVEKPGPQPVDDKIEPLRRDIFFVIRGTQISTAEMQKVREVAEYLYKYPNSRVTITGYADKGTGNPTINRNLSMKRANVVANTLKNSFGISADRITTDFKGDTEQPYAEQVKNRVSICVAQ